MFGKLNIKFEVFLLRFCVILDTVSAKKEKEILKIYERATKNLSL